MYPDLSSCRGPPTLPSSVRIFTISYKYYPPIIDGSLQSIGRQVSGMISYQLY